MNIFFRLIILCLIINTTIGYSFVEFHTHYGSGKGSPKVYNDAIYKTQTGPELSKQSFLGFDAIARFGEFPLRMGIRYESVGEFGSDFGEKVTMNGSRFSGVLNLRFINVKQYLGFIGTYGFSHNLQIELKNADQRYSTSSGKSSSFGLEGGVKFGPLRLGAEIGQLFLTYINFKDKDNLAASANGIAINKVDLSAPYYKLIIGVGF